MKVRELREFLEKCPQDVDVKFWVFRDCTILRTEVDPNPTLMRFHKFSNSVTIDVDLKCSNIIEISDVEAYREFKLKRFEEKYGHRVV